MTQTPNGARQRLTCFLCLPNPMTTPARISIARVADLIARLGVGVCGLFRI